MPMNSSSTPVHRAAGIFVLATLVLSSVFAAGTDSSNTTILAKKKISPQRLHELIRIAQAKKTGGVIRKEGSAKGVFVVLNAQRTVNETELARLPDILGHWMHVQSKVVKLDNKSIAPSRVKKLIQQEGGILGVALVDDDGPSLLVAPEDGWSVVNVAALSKDGAAASTVAARVRKEALRAFAFVAGGAYMARGEPLMRDITRPQDLDTVAIEQFGVETVTRVRESAPLYGLTPWRQATYKVACEEGWAPAPTNDYQKAIWEQSKAEKERGPSNPIQIKP